MKKILLASICLLIPTLALARGGDDRMEHGPEHMVMMGSGMTGSGPVMSDGVTGNHIKEAIIKRDMPPTGSGGTMGSGMMMPPRPPMGSGSEMMGLGMAIAQLSPADRDVLIKMIKDYLVSKGIDPAKYAEIRKEIKDVKQETRDELKDMKNKNKDAMKAKRDEMKMKVWQLKSGSGETDKKNYVGHVTLIKQ